MGNNKYEKPEYVKTEGQDVANVYGDTLSSQSEAEYIDNNSNKPSNNKGSAKGNNSRYSLGQFYIPANNAPINGGGQGDIYRCRSTENSKAYIAKLYKSNAQHLDKIKLINSTLKNINHPNIVNVLDAGNTNEGNRFMVVMEAYEELEKDFLLFEKYQNNISKFNKLFVNVLRDMNQALIEIHRNNTYHSDIKPSNIMRYKGMNQDERYVLIDFGGSAVAAEKLKELGDDGKTLSATASFFTKGFQPPEMYMGNMRKRKANSKTDVYTLGMTMILLIAGVLPYADDMRNDPASEKEANYYKRNAKEGKNLYGILLPAKLPDCYVRLFEGVLYRGNDYTETKTYRWGDNEVAQWITYMSAGNYKKAAQMPFGNTGTKVETAAPKEEATTKRNKMYISYNNVDIQVGSEAEMVDAFAKNWNETINNVMNNTQWVNSFQRLGPDVAQLLTNAGKQMKQNPEKAESIFNKRIMERFGSEEFKESIFHNGKIYKNKMELGRNIFAVVSEKLKNGDNVKLLTYANAKSENRNDKFTKLLTIFQEGYLSEAINERGGNWAVSSSDMERIKRWEARMNSDNPDAKKGKTDDLINLLLLAYHLQEKATFEFDGKIYTEYSKFMQYLGNISRTDINKATTLSKRCIDNGSMKIPFYAWCMEVPDLKERPSDAQKPA